MSEIIQKWIINRLGVLIDFSSDTFNVLVCSGRLIAEILHNYDLITYDQLLLILPSDSFEVSYPNYTKYISVWLRSLNIDISECVINEICNGKRTAAIRLFYQIYLALENKDKLQFYAEQRKKEIIRPNSRFSVTAVKENDIDISVGPDHPLSAPLLENKDIIDWHKRRYETILKKCTANREKYVRYIHEKFDTMYSEKFGNVKNIRLLPTEKLDPLPCCVDRDHTYGELVELQMKMKNQEKFQEDPKKAKMIINRIKQKLRSEATEKEIKIQMEKMLLMELWETLLNRQEKEFESMISQKLLKQSIYEKQMATKMFEVRQHKQNMLQNRQIVNEDIMKKREDEFSKHFLTREKSVQDQKYNYYFEKDRTLELHKRLYADKQRLKAEKNYELCKNALKDIVDISLCHVEYKERFEEEEVPEHMRANWARLFLTEKPIFNQIEPIEDIVQNLDELPENLEKLYTKEIDRQNGMDEKEFENYCNYEWPWELDKYFEDYKNDLRCSELGMNVLGRAVHRVLNTKYPKPNPPPKPNLPVVEVASCINGLTDVTILPVLQQLLQQKNIKVIEMQDAINFCLDAYKDETTTEYADAALTEATQTALSDLTNNKHKAAKVKGKVAKKGKKSKAKSKQSLGEIGSELEIIKTADKLCQTPHIYPCEEIVLSYKAELGKVASESLGLGEELTDHLIVAMFVEYLQHLKDIGGWVLVNYPTSYEQAALFEEALTAIPVPIISERLKMADSIFDIAELEQRSIENRSETEDEKRKSKILPDPTLPEEKIFYETYLTAYINTKPIAENDSNRTDRVEETEKEPEPLEQFYMDQGCCYNLYYKTFDLQTIKHLAKLIIGDYRIPPKTSLELFGDTFLYMEARYNQNKTGAGKESAAEKIGNKKKEKLKKIEVPKEDTLSTENIADGKGKKGKKTDKDAKGKKGEKEKKGKKIKQPSAEVVIVHEHADKEVQVPEPEEEIEVEIIEPLPEPSAGEALWKYCDVSIPQFFQRTLATLWENAEEVYIMDFRELFFIKRAILNAVVPYTSYIKKHMRTFIARPDYKQTHLHNFQNLYNDIDADLRDDAELKAELHCRIAEFREKLWHICDQKMHEAEEERLRLISDNWVAKQMCELCNNYITALQLEIDRFVDSFQFLIDYYSSSITKMPSEEELIKKIQLKKIEHGSGFEPTPEIANLNDVVESLMRVVGIAADETPFNSIIDNSYGKALDFVEKWYKSSLSVAAKLASMFDPKGAESDKKDCKKGTAKSNKKDKESKGSKVVEPEEEVKEVAGRLIEELNCALKGETARVKLRLKLLNMLAKKEFSDVFSCAQKTFHGLYNDVLGRYEREMKSVNEACEILFRAVEAEISLQPQLVLDGDKFYIEPDVLLFPDPPILLDYKISEHVKEGVFTIEQLDKVVTIFQNLAPNGSFPERTFVYLLEDMVVNDKEEGATSVIPDHWKRLLPNEVSQLSSEIFGKSEYVEWKDFIIDNLCVLFPNEEELMNVRDQFRSYDPDDTETVKDYQFKNVKFWFEVDNDTDAANLYRIDLLKNLLLRLYKIDEETLNYTALLLAFCKDENPIVGAAKALEVSLGKYVCWDCTVGETYIKRILHQRYLDEEERLRRELELADTTDMAREVVDSLIDKTVHLCDGISIEDYLSQKSISSQNKSLSQKSSSSQNKHLSQKSISSQNKHLSQKSSSSRSKHLSQKSISSRNKNLSQKSSSSRNKNVQETNSDKKLNSTTGSGVNSAHNSSSAVDLEFIEMVSTVPTEDQVTPVLTRSSATIITENKFSNVEIGFEETPGPPKAYFLPFEVLLTVMVACLPWHSRVQNIQDESFRQKLEVIYNSNKNPDFNDVVFVHELLNSPLFNEILDSNNRFAAKYPPDIVQKLISERNDM